MRGNKRIQKLRKTLLITLLLAAFITGLSFIFRDIFLYDDRFFVNVDIDSMPSLSEMIDSSHIDKELSLDVNFLNDDYFYSELNVSEYDLKGEMISGDFFIKGKILKGIDGRSAGVSGKMFSDNITFNSSPFRKMSMSFRIKDDVLEIENLRLGRSYGLKGSLALFPPYETDLHLTVERADIRDAAMLTKLKDPNVALGMMRGFFDIKGPLTNLSSNGMIESRNGKIGPIEYSLISLKLEGLGPIISIADSSLRQKGKGLLTMEGYMDLRNIKKGNLFDGITVRSDMMTIVWDGWDISKENSSHLSMTKEINDNMIVGFKTIASEPLTTYYDRERPEEMSIEYKVGKENLKMKLKEDEEYFVVEHNIKF
ncbi:MAG: hypothetical protein ABH848_04140 [Candidatus Omnitrophota bacterium]